MEDPTGKSSIRVDIAGGWFLDRLLDRLLVWLLDRGWGWGCGLRRLGQSLLLAEEEWAYQQDGRQQQSPVKNASVHNQLSRRRKRYGSITRAEASA
jgi:hypothetical protein